MGTIDLRSKDDNSAADLGCHVHRLPCCIRYDGPTEVSHYFKPKCMGAEIDGLKVEEAHFRGKKLQGATISLPHGYSGFVLGQKSNRNPHGKRKASGLTGGNPCWEMKATFDKLTYWNHDSLPSKDDTFVRSFHWLTASKTLHKPVTAEDLAAEAGGEEPGQCS
ncbi:PREDICTED: uncharacterized protein C12B10.15c [Tarenaya hassleriana]|uniref:uncharacterized protein C12B10.15c n=1 Tax=Tarenaya hassleriana TaxID=28532 RepID=UPI00053C5E29|nr:PREDICTED: uncharacterized protein C12B10.15c [Tarenaya hassleriana]XP_010554572.1 PREDICTED: uncharacterized protein C12B10.15c [Tarenaya hassleriana]XP_010554573.1 PREDICTED: uncharacterized protein C12B10.15c [Tarenaya hassleriana]XP_010554574.1 PREDICTED: uncharacterized protein C12B10.15c [Tarenaya hassleriana]XP_010554575.1 PREDICTED: uncharacterized protein C12B10.15c [Tarenaya hassleriana]